MMLTDNSTINNYYENIKFLINKIDNCNDHDTLVVEMGFLLVESAVIIKTLLKEGEEAYEL